MLEFLQNVIIVNLGILLVIIDLIGLAVAGEWILDRIRPEGQSTSLDEED